MLVPAVPPRLLYFVADLPLGHLTYEPEALVHDQGREDHDAVPCSERMADGGGQSRPGQPPSSPSPRFRASRPARAKLRKTTAESPAASGVHTPANSRPASPL